MVISVRQLLEDSSIYEVRNLDNLTAVSDPTVNDDSSEGYTVKSLWLNTVSGEVFRCINASEGAAVWVLTSLGIDDLGTAALSDSADFATAAQGALAASAVQPAALDDYLKSNGSLKFASVKAELPTPVSGVITIPAGVAYMIGGTIDLTGDRIFLQEDAALLGVSSASSKVLSTGLSASQPSEALVSSVHTCRLHAITLDGNGQEGYPLINMDATANPGESLDWSEVNFVNGVGALIKNYTNAIFDVVGVLGTYNFDFDGTFDTVSFSDSIFVGTAGQSTGRVLSTATINRRFRVVYSAIVTPATGTGFDVQSAASFPNAESAILDTVAFSGSGAPSSATLLGTNKTLFVNCTGGVINNNGIHEYYMEGNVTATTITVAGTYYKAAGTTTEGQKEKFTMSGDNEVTYNGAFSAYVKIDVDLSVSTGSNNQTIGVRIYKDTGGGFVPIAGSRGRVRGATAGEPYLLGTHVVDFLNPGDKISVYITNETSTAAVTVTDLNVVALRT